MQLVLEIGEWYSSRLLSCMLWHYVLLVSNNRVSAISVEVVPPDERLRGEGLVWLIGAVVCLLAATAGPVSVNAAADDRICAAAPLALANQLPLLRLSKRAVLSLPCN